MDYNKIFTVILFVFFIIGCKDVNNDLDIDVVRFEKQFYNSDEKQRHNKHVGLSQHLLKKSKILQIVIVPYFYKHAKH